LDASCAFFASARFNAITSRILNAGPFDSLGGEGGRVFDGAGDLVRAGDFGGARPEEDGAAPRADVVRVRVLIGLEGAAPREDIVRGLATGDAAEVEGVGLEVMRAVGIELAPRVDVVLAPVGGMDGG